MDIRLREIAAGPAGTYFIVTDNSSVEEIQAISNLRVVPINVESGVVNTLVVFQKGDTAGFTSIFGKGLRKQEKQGNFSISECLTMLEAGPIGVINLRAFDSTIDRIGVAGLSPNKTVQSVAETGYQNVFNTNGFWVPKGKNIPDLLTNQHLLNFANIGKGGLSYFVTVSSSAETLTDQYDQTLLNTDLEIEDFPALTADMKVSDTFVDVWIFNNTFDAGTVSTNQFFGHLFNNAGLIDFGNLQALSEIKESGFNRKITGSVIPFFKNENDEDISIDTLVNSVYAETGLLAFINDDVLEDETIDNGSPVINNTGKNYYDFDGSLLSTGSLYSHRLQPVLVQNLDINTPADMIKDVSKEALVEFGGDIFSGQQDNLEEFGNQVINSFNSGIRAGDVIMFEDLDSNETKEVIVKSIALTGFESEVPFEIALDTQVVALFNTAGSISQPKLHYSGPVISTLPEVDKLQLWRKSENDAAFTLLVDNFQQYDLSTNAFTDTNVQQNLKYQYSILVIATANFLSSYGPAQEVTLGATPVADSVIATFPVIPSNASKKTLYKETILTLSAPINANTYFRRLIPIQDSASKLQFTNLSAYVPRVSQFTNGTASRQNEILDVLNSPSILKGLKNFDGVSKFVDVFKSFVEGSYKYQFGQLMVELDKCNKFTRAIINEPFIESLEDSVNPLFKQLPGGTFDATYIATGGNPAYSTNFLSKFTTGASMCYFFGNDNVVGPNSRPLAGRVSNAFLNKTFAWDVVANTTGYLDGITALGINPDDKERKAMETFRWNPVIKLKTGFTIYGNATGVRGRSALSQIHNSELLAYIKESLYNMSQTENFKKGTYDEYLRFETQVTSFMEALVNQGAIQPNPVVICNASNNTTEVSKQKIKLCRIEYFNIDALDKVVFDLELN